MEKAPEEVTVLAPAHLVSTGGGWLSFVLEFENFDGRRYDAECEVEVTAPAQGARTKTRVRQGLASLVLPGDLYGQAPVLLRIDDHTTGRRLEGAFVLKVRTAHSGPGGVTINAGGQVQGSAVNYQPIEVHGAELRPIEPVGERMRIHVPLREVEPKPGAAPGLQGPGRHRQGAVPLEEVLQREFLVLDEGDPTRVLAVHVGEELVVGRCYTADLPGEARDRLQKACGREPPAVDWVTVWENHECNRLMALVHVEVSEKGSALRVENLTDYSTRAESDLLVMAGGGTEKVGPGEAKQVPVDPGQRTVLALRRGQQHVAFLKIVLEEVAVGKVVLPVVRTQDSGFRWDSREIRFLGLWVPRSREELQRILRTSGGPLRAGFPEETRELDFEIRWDATSDSLMMAGTVDLRECLDRG